MLTLHREILRYLNDPGSSSGRFAAFSDIATCIPQVSCCGVNTCQGICTYPPGGGPMPPVND